MISRIDLSLHEESFSSEPPINLTFIYTFSATKINDVMVATDTHLISKAGGEKSIDDDKNDTASDDDNDYETASDAGGDDDEKDDSVHVSLPVPSGDHGTADTASTSIHDGDIVKNDECDDNDDSTSASDSYEFITDAGEDSPPGTLSGNLDSNCTCACVCNITP